MDNVSIRSLTIDIVVRVEHAAMPMNAVFKDNVLYNAKKDGSNVVVSASIQKKTVVTVDNVEKAVA